MFNNNHNRVASYIAFAALIEGSDSSSYTLHNNEAYVGVVAIIVIIYITISLQCLVVLVEIHA